jgi:hypothetical protein
MTKTMTNDQTAPSEPSWRRIVVGVLGLTIAGAAAVVLFPVVLLLLGLGGLYLVSCFVPAYSAEHHIAEIATTVRLSFYRVWDETTDSGRYLTVTSPKGSLSQKLCGFDWAHRSRTNLYLTPSGNIAVLGPSECNYMIASSPLHREAQFELPSESWSYLGAFDLVWQNTSVYQLRFIPASEDPECIQTYDLPERPDVVGGLRYSARRAQCPEPVSRAP